VIVCDLWAGGYVMVLRGVHGPALEVKRCRLTFDEAMDELGQRSFRFGVVAELAVPEHPPGAWLIQSASERKSTAS
jgi:hypothetical protein